MTYCIGYKWKKRVVEKFNKKCKNYKNKSRTRTNFI